MKEAIQINISKKLSEKYEEVRVIYESTASLVVLVRHVKLDHERIIKRVAKSSYDMASESGSVREALILLNLRHPNIPILYDLDEDEDYYYIVEEYIVGESMADYLYLHQSISHSELIQIAIVLYDVLDYLHNLKTPICYQDVKLEHIFLSNGRIVLIDYGIATYLKGNEHATYATLSYASDMQLIGKCDTSSDIYNTKVALKRIYDSGRQKRDFEIERLLNVNNNLSAAEEKSKWLLLSDKKNMTKKHLDSKVAVVGNDKGIGVSHIAIALTCYLNNIGVVSYYQECSDNSIDNYHSDNNIEKIMLRDKSFNEGDNIIYHDCFKGIRQVGEAIEDNYLPPKGLIVGDVGTNVSLAMRFDAVVYVISSRIYKSNEIDDIVSNPNTVVIINPKSIGIGVEVAKLIGKRVYSFPIDEDPFAITKTKDKALGQIVKRLNLG